MTAKSVSELAKEYRISVEKMVQELTLIENLKFHRDRKRSNKIRIIFPVDLKVIYKHLGDPGDN